MTNEQVEKRNETILNNWINNRELNDSTELSILCAILNVKLPQTVKQNFVSSELDEHKRLCWTSYGSDKLTRKTLDKLERVIEQRYGEKPILLSDKLDKHLYFNELYAPCYKVLHALSDGSIQLSYGEIVHFEDLYDRLESEYVEHNKKYKDLQRKLNSDLYTYYNDIEDKHS